MVRVSLLLLLAAIAHSSGTMLQRRILPDALVHGLGARCMDGSAGGYYDAPGSGANATKLVIYIQGGGECRTQAECIEWYSSHQSNSTEWEQTMALATESQMDPNCSVNPDWCTWRKIFIPYCTGDMHSGQQTERNPSLGNFYFSGHLQIKGVVADIKAGAGHGGKYSPTHVLVVGSSAGGIAALMHTDYFAEQWPAPTVVKGAPECGFFYPGVTASNDVTAGVPTPASHLGFIEEWKPYLPSACAEATNSNVSLCTDAHYLYPYLRAPLFIRENQYDTAKLANCGWDTKDEAYLKLWGEWMRAQLAVIRTSPKDGFFSGSCLEHGGNFGWVSSPVIDGVSMQSAMRNWYFELGDGTSQFIMDNCSVVDGSGLPCTVAGAGRCPHLSPSGGLSTKCMSELNHDCVGLQGKGEACGDCVRHHSKDLETNGCPAHFKPVYDGFCATIELNTNVQSSGHHVCDLSVSRRIHLFGE